jgi:Tfp pilus assembly protein FimT
MRQQKKKISWGFSLIELMLVVSVIITLAAILVPRMMNTISDITLRYTATDLSGLLQTARIQAVKKNTFYTVQQATLASGATAYYADLPQAGVYTNSDPMFPLDKSITAHQGIGSGAPNEGSFISGLNFTVNPGGDPPSFNARGLPCIAAAGACPQNAGQGFVIFLSKANLTGSLPWAAVVINPSGHIQLWTSDAGGSWTQRN